MNTQRFLQYTVVVTGAASGVGRAVAARFLAEGASVAGLDLATHAPPESAGAGKYVAVKTDVADRESLASAATDVIDRLGPADVLVNCAGIVTMHGLEELADDDWNKVMAVNLTGPFLTTQVFLGQLKQASGRGKAVVNITSVESDRIIASGASCQPHYSASKGGLLNLTRAMAHELGRYAIRVNAVAPGPVATAFAGIDYTTDQAQQAMQRAMVFPRPVTPEEIAASVAFLSSPDAEMITGVELAVDGGYRIH